MKKYLSCIICIAVIICFMFSSCMGVPQVTEPIADPSDQKFNTWDQYLPITLKTESGNESRVAVKLVLETDNAEENKVRERLASDERLSAKMILDDSPGWNMDMMRLVKIRLLIMPWENSNFTEDKVLFTVYTGMYLNGNALGGACFGPIESEQVRTSSTFSTDLEGWQSCGASATKGESVFEPFVYVYSPMVLTKPFMGSAYYETVIYALLPTVENTTGDALYVIAVTNDDSSTEAFMSFTLEDVPTKGKLLWEIPVTGSIVLNGE